ncbi:hypothetical protein AZE42_14007 [Rhizopogon vesiculosus]|uniref:Uncharacterized protein n=1 Tax=Rhizopogon vesiculosus TaxID=180088 RepID=A0A1J8RFR5_9AGAM|nr:hypothetical protein AZE42_14007 [Rhizopogon vesiculosus]
MPVTDETRVADQTSRAVEEMQKEEDLTR